MRKAFVTAVLIMGFVSTGGVRADQVQVDPFYEKLFTDGVFFFDGESHAQAVENFEIAFFGFLDHPERLLECYLYLAAGHFKLRNFEKAAHYLDEIDRLHLLESPDDLDIPRNLADALRETIVHLNRIGLRPQTWTIPEARDETQIRKPSDPLLQKARDAKSLRKKIAFYNQALQQDPGNIEIYLEIAAAYIAGKKYREGVEVLTGILETEENNEARYLLGKARMSLKQYGAAAAEFSFLLDRSPGYKDAPALFERCLERIER